MAVVGGVDGGSAGAAAGAAAGAVAAADEDRGEGRTGKGEGVSSVGFGEGRMMGEEGYIFRGRVGSRLYLGGGSAQRVVDYLGAGGGSDRARQRNTAG